MTNGSLLLLENESIFSPISVLNYSYYDMEKEIPETLANLEDLQCICGQNGVAFGQVQNPSLMDYADGVDTMQFLLTL